MKVFLDPYFLCLVFIFVFLRPQLVTADYYLHSVRFYWGIVPVTTCMFSRSDCYKVNDSMQLSGYPQIKIKLEFKLNFRFLCMFGLTELFFCVKCLYIRSIQIQFLYSCSKSESNEKLINRPLPNLMGGRRGNSITQFSCVVQSLLLLYVFKSLPFAAETSWYTSCEFCDHHPIILCGALCTFYVATLNQVPLQGCHAQH